jgi:hypothetical protein
MSVTDDELRRSLSALVNRLLSMPQEDENKLSPLGEILEAHLGTDPRRVPLITERVPAHLLVDADVALEELGGADGRVIGIAGGQERHHETLITMATRRHFAGNVGPVEYTPTATGFTGTRDVVALGVRLLRFAGTPLAILQRQAMPMFGREQAELDILSADRSVIPEFLDALHRVMNERSVIRGAVVTFAPGDGHRMVGSLRFLPRPEVPAADVILPDGVLDAVSKHVIGIGERAELLRSLGQHLKRGVLLYGPPGTGKTLTVRHLIGATSGVTVIVLQGNALAYVTAAASLARSLAPAMVVLEDVDLIAMERASFGGPQPLLFEILDAMDGIDGDADVAFVLTTNRADVLEPALAARPGRVDLAMSIPLPDLAARRSLFHIYGRALDLDGSIWDRVAERTAGVTASFAKEFVRRVVLRGDESGSAPDDTIVDLVLAEMMEAADDISRALFGNADAADR